MCEDTSDWMGGLAPIGTVCVPHKKKIQYQGGGIDFGKFTPVNAYKMCIVEHEDDNARFGRVSTYKN